MSQHWQITIRDDPSLGAKQGDQIRFELASPQGLEESGLIEAGHGPNGSNGVLLSWHFVDRERRQHYLHGTAVMVAPGIAISAKHVLEPHLDQIMRGEITSSVAGVGADGMIFWEVHQITPLPEMDLVILRLILRSEMPQNRTFHCVPITTRLPKVGERLQMFGMSALSAYVEDHGPRLGFQAVYRTFASAGIVTNRYPSGRDRAMLPWPCLEVDCGSRGGMSGGPVFDESGLLVGVLCSSFDDAGPSYVSLIWPALCVPFIGGWPDSIRWRDKAMNLVERCAHGCTIDKPEALHITYLPESGQVDTTYYAWE